MSVFADWSFCAFCGVKLEHLEGDIWWDEGPRDDMMAEYLETLPEDKQLPHLINCPCPKCSLRC